MVINLRNASKRVNSTGIPAAGTDYTGRVVEPCSVINPVIKFAEKHNNNYAYIADFGRYYWVDDWTFQDGFWWASMHVDVLASYKDTIGSASRYVLRAAAAQNGAIIDNKYPVKVDPLIPVSASYPILTGGAPWTGTFMMGVISPYGENGGVTIFALTAAEFLTVRQNLMGNDDYWANITDIDLKNLAICISDPLQYITWCRYYPFSLPAGSTTSTTMKLGKISITGMPMLNANMTLWESSQSISIGKHPQYQSRGEWLNSEPYSNYYIHWAPIGKIQIPSVMLHGLNSMSMLTKIDFLSGMGNLKFIQPGLGGNVIYSTDFMIGCDVPLSQVMSSNPMGLLSTGVGLAGTAASALTGNIPGAIAGGVGAVGSFIDSVSPSVKALGASKGSLISSGEYLHFIEVFNRMADDDNVEYGRPLCEVRQLSTLSGYQLVRDGDIPITGTAAEQEQVRQFLESGYFYE